MKVAFSSVACPEWTLQRIASEGEAAGFNGVELRTFGSNGGEFAGEPFLTDPAKTRSIMENAGLEIVSLATGLKFDDPIAPAIIGHIFGDQEKAIRACKSAINLAAQLECPFVRVFAFEIQGQESRKNALARIIERLNKCLDACDRTGVKLLIENGGSFNRASDLIEIMDIADNGLLMASYSVAVAAQAGEDVAAGVNALGKRLGVLKIKDYKDGQPCTLGTGTVPNGSAMCAARTINFTGPVVFEYDRAWNRSLPDPKPVLQAAAPIVHSWAHATKAPSCVTVK